MNQSGQWTLKCTDQYHKNAWDNGVHRFSECKRRINMVFGNSEEDVLVDET